MTKRLSDEDVERIAQRVAELIPRTTIVNFPAVNPGPNWPVAPSYIGPYVYRP